MQTFTAKYPSFCADCETPIKAGEEIVFRASPGEPGKNIYIHAECPDNIDTPDYGFCDSCFISLPATKVCTNCN